MRRSNIVNEKTVNAVLRKWRPLLGLDSRWLIDVRIVKEKETWPYEDACAAVKPAPGYFQARLLLHEPQIKEDDHTLEHIVLHELVHIVLWPLCLVVRDALGDDHEATWRDMMEAAVEQMTRALLRKKSAK